MRDAAVWKRQQSPPPALPEFAHINRYWDPVNLTFAAKLLPGEFYVTLHDEMITTVLGSCVAACIRDRVKCIGGMNHYMLPSMEPDEQDLSDRARPAATRYGMHAMERLIDAIIQYGGRRENLEVKVFGGGKIVPGMIDVGRQNIEFIRAYLRTTGLPLAAEDLGGPYPRKVNYYPASARARVKKLRSLRNDTIVQRERNYQSVLRQAANTRDPVFPSSSAGEAGE